MLSSNIVTAVYIAASVLFILSLGGLSNQEKAKRAVWFGIVGMALAVFGTVFGPQVSGFIWIIPMIIIGSIIGTVVAQRVEMTGMPQLVAALHSFVGIAAVFIGINSHIEPPSNLFGAELIIHDIEIFIGVFIGAVTATGSVIAYGKLSGTIDGKALLLPARNWLNLAAVLFCIWLGALFLNHVGSWPLYLMTIVALIFGAHLVMAIGGADMPVVVSMLNSYSGWAAAGIGFSLGNSMLIVAGSLVGSSGAILSYIMCKAMNRAFLSVILGGFGGETDLAQSSGESKPIKTGSADDAAFMLGNADSVIIVPGYGLAVARAQHALKELTDKLIEKGIQVRYAIHPVAGRMPGHMNVLLAEAEVPYDQVFEMEDINSEFNQTDVVLVLGANDVVNPAAKTPGSAIYGMPILEVFKAQSVIVNKRSMASGYAGLDNELFYMDSTMMVFGDAKKIIEEIGKAAEN